VVGRCSSTCYATASPPSTACRWSSTRASSQLARWISAADRKKLDEFAEANRAGIADDLDGDLVYLAAASSIWTTTRERAPAIVFTDVKDVKAVKAIDVHYGVVSLTAHSHCGVMPASSGASSNP